MEKIPGIFDRLTSWEDIDENFYKKSLPVLGFRN